MSNVLSEKLRNEAMELRSTTIESPAGRKKVKGENKGEPATCSVYFDEWTTDDSGLRAKYHPVEGCTSYTKDAKDAKAIEGCVRSDIKTAKCPDTGEKLYWRFDKLSKALKADYLAYTSKDVSDVVANKFKAACKQLTNQAIMSMPIEDRKHLAQWVGSVVMPAINKLESISSTGKKKEKRITIW